jgi:L-asparagine transporter-like permease
MKKNIALYGFIFFIITQLLFFIFPNQLLGNIYILIIYFFICIVLLYLNFIIKKKEGKTQVKKPTRFPIFFYLFNMLLFFILPKQLTRNIYIIGIYLFFCFIFLYFFYNRKSKNEQESIK